MTWLEYHTQISIISLGPPLKGDMDYSFEPPRNSMCHSVDCGVVLIVMHEIYNKDVSI